jgi:diaminopimelate decarboxylase
MASLDASTPLSHSLGFPFSDTLAQTLIQSYRSPLYVYNGDRLNQTIAQITQAFPYPQIRFQFASVTNGNLTLLQRFHRMGWGLHANTPGDIYLGLKAGFLPQQIVYSGSNLSRNEMQQLLDWGITTFNLDSVSQLQQLCEVYSPDRPPIQLGLRLNYPPLTGDSRIGVQPQEFPAAVAIAAQEGLQIRGLHFYRGTGTNATQAFTQVIDDVIAIAQLLPDWRYLDFGGGFGYPYRPNGIAFQWQDFGSVLADRLSRLERSIELIIEPGRAAIAGCATLLAQVVSTKWQDQKQIVGLDTTVANLSVPAVHGGYRQILSWKGGTTYSSDVCGNTTYSRDYLGRNCLLPALAIGDIIAILDVGAYGYAMSSHFLHRPRPAEVLLEQNQHSLIRHRETYDVLISHQI